MNRRDDFAAKIQWTKQKNIPHRKQFRYLNSFFFLCSFYRRKHYGKEILCPLINLKLCNEDKTAQWIRVDTNNKSDIIGRWKDNIITSVWIWCFISVIWGAFSNLTTDLGLFFNHSFFFLLFFTTVNVQHSICVKFHVNFWR